MQPEFLEEEHTSAAPCSSSEEGGSDDELLPDGAQPTQFVDEAPAVYACEIQVTDRDLRRLLKKPKKAAVWLSQKMMMEKGKEVDWRRLTETEKKEYDEAQAVGVSNVVRERAVRALTSRELAEIDHSKVVGMRWVLTRKSSGAAKARLVVLGYQAHNLLDVDKAAPTLSRTGRNMLLAAASNAETGDVTSAFLQSMASL